MCDWTATKKDFDFDTWRMSICSENTIAAMNLSCTCAKMSKWGINVGVTVKIATAAPTAHEAVGPSRRYCSEQFDDEERGLTEEEIETVRNILLNALAALKHPDLSLRMAAPKANQDSLEYFDF
jgi:hypothetical protein